MSCLTSRPRLLIVPGLRNSGPAHWQTWLQSLHRDAVRVEQADWDTPDLDGWADRISDTLAREGDEPWLVAAHSFGSLAVAHHLATQGRTSVRAALLVAPADPAKFGLEDRLPQLPLPVPTTLFASDTDPWMRATTARFWAQRWGARWLSLGDAGHINAESGFGPLPRAQRWVESHRQRLASGHRLARTDAAPWQFAV